VRVLNLLGDVFSRSQHVTDKEFISKLEQGGIKCTVRRIDAGTYIEVSRFGYPWIGLVFQQIEKIAQ
jgi:hypothetical protein